MAHIPFEPTIAGAQAPPPYECTGVKAFGFPLLADALPLQDLCDQFLSIDPPSAGISFEPILVAPNTCSVTLEALDYQSLRPTTPPWSDLGGTSQQELLFAVPVVRKQNGDPTEIGIFIPYIFVDNLGSALAGREVLGLPKLLANFTLDRDFPDSGPIVLRFDTPKTATAPAQSNEIVKITATSDMTVSTNAFDMFLGPLDAFAYSRYFDLILAQAAGPTVGFSTRILIQHGSSTADAFRSIMRSTYTTTVVRDSGQLAPVNVTLSSIVALDIQSTLGITPGPDGMIPSFNPFFLDFDFDLGGLTTVWQS
jgi:hypothetical protein